MSPGIEENYRNTAGHQNVAVYIRHNVRYEKRFCVIFVLTYY